MQKPWRLRRFGQSDQLPAPIQQPNGWRRCHRGVRPRLGRQRRGEVLGPHVAAVRRAAQGRDVGSEFATLERGVRPFFAEHERDGPARLYVRMLDSTGQLIGIAERARTPGLLHPSVVLV